MDLKYEIYNSSCQFMNMIKDNSVKLVFTSPPYRDLKDYHNDWQIWYKQTYQDYLNDMKIVFSECYRVLDKENWVFCINIHSRVVNNKYYPIHIDFYRILKAIWFNFFDCFIWHKASWIPAPANKFSDRFEYVIIASMKEISYKWNKSEWYLSDELNAIKSWHVKKKAGSLLSTQPHPAYFPIWLPEKAISLYTEEWDLVLDPFMWIWSTLFAALNLKRSCVWFEINPDYINTIDMTTPMQFKGKIKFI